jgi:hypothetical protein
MIFTLENEGGRRIAEGLELPGTLVYGALSGDAVARAKAFALCVVADRLEHGEAVPILRALISPRHEPVAERAVTANPRITDADRLECEAPDWLTQSIRTFWVA